MPTAFEVPANELINKLAKHLKENVSEISPPPWSEYAKTGAHKERPPQDPDWWYARCASLLRKIYVHGRAGGSAIREPLQQLQKAELVAIEGRKGRKLTKQGLTLLNRTSAEVAKELKARPREAPS